jgi:AcrR family transcriptional regulator
MTRLVRLANPVKTVNIRMWDGVTPMTPPPVGHTARDADATADGKITRDMVLATALAIIDSEGADALTMRRLARALDPDPMILYRHTPNQAALLDGVAETVLTKLQVDSADPDWPGACRHDHRIRLHAGTGHDADENR